MQKILLFSRNDLVNLYGELCNDLSGRFQFIHLAYSKKEEDILRENYQITNVRNFKSEIAELYANEKSNPSLINEIDQLIIEQTEGRFCLNSAIQSDRTFSYLSYDECLLMTQVYYRFWIKLIEEIKFNFLFHEPVALFFLQIASVVCKKHGASYLTQINVFGEEKYNWIFVSAENGFPVEMPFYLNDETFVLSQTERAKKFLSKFRSEFNLILPELASHQHNEKKNHLKLFFKMFKLILGNFKSKLKSEKRSINVPLNHVEYYLSLNRTSLSDKLKNLWDEYFHQCYDDFDPGKNYYYYPMHMEPEAVVLYWGEGLYKNQVKLIENIAGQLPPDHYLYVKVHPIVKEERYFVDYKRIKAIPNVKLLGPKVPGKLIISHSKGVMTINGTSGFEAALLNKPVFVFGNSFFDLSDRVIKVKNIRDLRWELYSKQNHEYTDDQNLLKFIGSFLLSSNKGFTAYYLDYVKRLGIDHKENVKAISEGISKSINVLQQSTTVRLLLKQNQLVRKFMNRLVQIGSVKQLI